MQSLSRLSTPVIAAAILMAALAGCNKGDATSSASGGPGNSTGTASGSTSGGSTSATIGADNGSGKLRDQGCQQGRQTAGRGRQGIVHEEMRIDRRQISASLRNIPGHRK